MIILLLNLILSNVANGSNINDLKVYDRMTIVTDIDEENDIVICTDLYGFEWEFYGVEDWFVGDIANLTMYNNGTQIIFDDFIISTTYSGTMDMWNYEFGGTM